MEIARRTLKEGIILARLSLPDFKLHYATRPSSRQFIESKREKELQKPVTVLFRPSRRHTVSARHGLTATSYRI
jgi:hypothetical protein